MPTGPLLRIATGLLQVVLVLALAPLLQGVARRLTARVQSRRGPPLRQSYLDVLKLLGKEDLESGESPLYQRFAAVLALGTALTVACLVPMGWPAPMGEVADVMLLVCVLVLSGVSTLLAGTAAGSTYALLGTSREMMTMVALEPVLAMAVVVGALHAGSFRLDAVLAGAAWFGALPLSGVVILAATLLALQGFVARVPFDQAEAETELMDGPFAEYSGRKLALFKLAQMVKLVDYGALVVALFFPWGASLPFPLSLLAFWAKVLVVVALVTFVAATHARYRMDQALRYYGALLATSLGAVALASHGL